MAAQGGPGQGGPRGWSLAIPLIIVSLMFGLPIAGAIISLVVK